MDGAHTIERCYEATDRTLRAVFRCLHEQRVPLEQIAAQAEHGALGHRAARSRRACARWPSRRCAASATRVPAAVPGIVFLSGGQSDELATAHLNEMNRLGGGPWELSFSYGRALQAPTLKSWRGKPRECGRGPEGLPAPRALQRRGPQRQLQRGDGEGRLGSRARAQSTRPRVSRPRPAFGRRRPSRPAARGPQRRRSTTSPT